MARGLPGTHYADEKMHLHIAQMHGVENTVRGMERHNRSVKVQQSSCHLLANVSMNGML
jgi:hypothetical protein